MNLKYSFFSLHLIFIIINLNISTTVFAENRRSASFQKGSFKRNLVKSPHEYFRVISIVKQFDNTFDELVNLHLHYVDAVIRNDVLNIFDYLYEGFELLNNISKPNFQYPVKLIFKNYKEPKIGKFFDILNNIENIFDYTFINYLGDFGAYTQPTINYFLGTTIKNETFKNDLKFLHNNTLQMKNPSDIHIFRMYLHELNHTASIGKNCGDAPVSSKLFTLYEQTLIGVTKGYSMLIIAHEFLRLMKFIPDNYRDNQFYYLTQYRETITNITISARQILNLLEFEHRIFVNCDPQWKEGKNYIRVKNYVSDIMSRIKDYDEDFKSKNDIYKEFECNSYMVHSNFNSLSIYSMRCPEVFDTNTNLNEKCRDSLENNEFVNNTYLNWSVKCSFLDDERQLTASCFCDQLSDPQLSIRKLSLREIYTNTDENRVVTGIRFAVKNNVIKIEIQEGKIKNDVIDPKTLIWKNTNNGYPTEKDPNTVTLNYNIKSFNLDDIDLPFGQFVTGVKFELLEDNHISLVVRGTIMYDDYSEWSSIDHEWHYPKTLHSEDREKIQVEDYQNSAELSLQNQELSQSGRNYIDLSVGIYSNNFKNIPVIPFFDSQNLTSNPPSPLGGLGLYYKGYPSFGGFLAFKCAESQFNFNVITKFTT